MPLSFTALSRRSLSVSREDSSAAPHLADAARRRSLHAAAQALRRSVVTAAGALLLFLPAADAASSYSCPPPSMPRTCRPPGEARSPGGWIWVAVVLAIFLIDLGADSGHQRCLSIERDSKTAKPTFDDGRILNFSIDGDPSHLRPARTPRAAAV
ncbi:unnamed protein product [Urochloa humidicola]